MTRRKPTHERGHPDRRATQAGPFDAIIGTLRRNT